MAKASVRRVSYRLFTLEMNEEEARWLKELLQNPVHVLDLTLPKAAEEDGFDTAFREAIYTALRTPHNG